jgi:excisionase family DNA binding protein
MAATLEQTIADALRPVIREELARALREAQPATMTVEQAASYTGRAPKTIRGWIDAGLPSSRKGRRVYLRRPDLDEWLLRPEQTTDAIVASLRRVG